MSESVPVRIDYYSDLLCIWAYAAQIRLDELRRTFGDQIEIATKFVPVFGSTRTKIVEGWKDRGGVAGYQDHVNEVARRFPHIKIDADVWNKTLPAGSLGPHAFIKAVQLVEGEGGFDRAVDPRTHRTRVEELCWRMRLAFFRYAEPITRIAVQSRLAAALDLPVDRIREKIDAGVALAALAEDHESAIGRHVSGSPTFVLNQGRQILYGNVGFKVIEANVQELLDDSSDRASWC